MENTSVAAEARRWQFISLHVRCCCGVIKTDVTSTIDWCAFDLARDGDGRPGRQQEHESWRRAFIHDFFQLLCAWFWYEAKALFFRGVGTRA